MAVTRFALTFSLLIATNICLMTTKAEEQQRTTEATDLQDKQIDLTTVDTSLSLGDESTPDGKHVLTEGQDDSRARRGNKPPQREATINIFPTFEQCLSTNVAIDGLGPCKVATQAERGVININFSNEIQTAVIGILANSQKHTRVKLICTEINQFVRLYSLSPNQQSGEINDTTDTPRIEVGYMQIVATVPDSDDSGVVDSDLTVKCSWVSYNHRTATYP